MKCFSYCFELFIHLFYVIIVLQPGYEKVNPIIRSFSTPVFTEKADSFRKDGKGYVLVRSASPRPSSSQTPRDNIESIDGSHPHASIEFDVEKGEDIDHFWGRILLCQLLYWATVSKKVIHMDCLWYKPQGRHPLRTN